MLLYLEKVNLYAIVQDNVFVHLVCSIQYRVIKQNADDAFYELQNPKEQIQAYVFDGNLSPFGFTFASLLLSCLFMPLSMMLISFNVLDCSSRSSPCPQNEFG